MSALLDYDLAEKPDAYRRACREWAEALPEWMVRSYAADYRHGIRDEATLDAWEEFQRRFPKQARGERRAARPKLVNRCEKHKEKVTPGFCNPCRELNGLAPLSRKRYL